MSPDLARTEKVRYASTAYRGMIGIDPYVLAIMPTAFTFWVNTWRYRDLYLLRILRSHQACLGGDDYQAEIVPQRVEQQEILSTGLNLNRRRER
jgi:hypothetical protein